MAVAAINHVARLSVIELHQCDAPNVRSKAGTPVRDQAVNRLSNEQLSCSELTGFRVVRSIAVVTWSGGGRFGVLPCRAFARAGLSSATDGVA